MKKFLIVSAVALLGVSLFGCGKKAEESQEPVSMEAMSTVNVTTPAVPETKAPEVKAPVAAVVEPAKVETPVFGKPTPLQIQAALKNAGLYTGEVDGKLGPKTKKAIQEFQKSNGLKADGKVGPKTWELLKVHLAGSMESATDKKR